MGVKKRNSFQFNWTSTLNSGATNSSGKFDPNVPLSGITNGAMSGTNTIYSNVQDLGNHDNSGLVITYTGTPTGVISVLASEFGDIFYALTFDPVLTQPSGSPGGYLINLNQFPWRYVVVQYANATGSGILTVSIGQKDLN